MEMEYLHKKLIPQACLKILSSTAILTQAELVLDLTQNMHSVIKAPSSPAIIKIIFEVKELTSNYKTINVTQKKEDH